MSTSSQFSSSVAERWVNGFRWQFLQHVLCGDRHRGSHSKSSLCRSRTNGELSRLSFHILTPAGDRRDPDGHLPPPLPSWEHDQREGGCCEQLRQVFIWSYKGCNIITLLPTTAPGDITPLARSRYTQPWKRWDRAKNIFRCHKIVQIRRMAGKCSGLQGFLVFHSFGGGNNDD